MKAFRIKYTATYEREALVYAENEAAARELFDNGAYTVIAELGCVNRQVDQIEADSQWT